MDDESWFVQRDPDRCRHGHRCQSSFAARAGCVAGSLLPPFDCRAPPPRSLGGREVGRVAWSAVPNVVVVADRSWSRFLSRGDGGGHAITVAFRSAGGGNVTTAITRAAGGGDLARGFWRFGWRRPGPGSAALLRAIRQVAVRSPRATRTVAGAVYRPGYHRSHRPDLRVSARNGVDVSRLLGWRAGGTVPAARMTRDARALGRWFSVSEVAAMGGGSGNLASTVLASAGSLAFERVAEIVRHRVRPAGASLSMVFGKSNKAMQRTIGAPTARGGSNGW